LDFFAGLFMSGVNALIDYLSLHVITCLVPALFIAGAISAVFSQAAILKYFGPKANKVMSYCVASVSGTVLAVCSCTVLPLFGGIYKRGAGLGPAVAFLYSGPAINVLAIVYTASLLGYDIGIARAVASIAFSFLVGILMAFIFRQDEAKKAENQAFAILTDEEAKPLWQQALFIGDLVTILILAVNKLWIFVGLAFIFLLVILWRFFTKEETINWLKETAHFTRMIFPWLLFGVFLAGMIGYLIPTALVAKYIGGNGLGANFGSAIFGTLMYFATLTEVPIVRALTDLGMGKGPALALLLTGPALSLPSILALRSIMGWKKSLMYAALVTVLGAFTGWIFGFFFA
jgi:uncharacterized membrane protein YraQ (UPF0718 family)